ncbi:MAG: DIP1984 family protein [Bacillota bacterium]
MKLAESLILRSDCQKRILQLEERLRRSAKVQEGETPPEKPDELLKELDEALSVLLDLIKKINKTNSIIEIEEGKSLADALAERDIISQKRHVLDGLVFAATIKQERYSKSEVKFFSTVDISQIQKQIDELSKKYRELDTKIQEKNWTVELIEN